MNRFQPREGTQAPYWPHMLYIADSVDQAFRSALSDYMSIAEDFFISGAVITETSVGTATQYAITAGHLVYKGEVMPIDAHTVVKAASQVVYITVQDDGVDTTPVPNLDGNTDYVMRRRHARMRVGPVYPTEHMVLTAPRKAELDLLRLKGRIVPTGGIIPYFGVMTHFSATGLGLANTPMEGWAVCNGLNGTVDMRGMLPVGATNVPSSGAPTPYSGVGSSTDPGDAIGQDLVQITPDQLPEHTHPIDFPHASYWTASGGLSNINGSGTGDGSGLFPSGTEPNVTNQDTLDVRSSSRALVYIQSIL